MEDYGDKKTFSENKSIFPLFPSTTDCHSSTHVSSSLFPSGCSENKTLSAFTEAKKGLDWLENKSYTAETADKLVSFQAELHQTLEQQSRATAAYTNDHVESTTTTTQEKRAVVSRDNSEESDREERRKKKHKHKHKKKHKKHKRDSDDLPKTELAPEPKNDLFSSNKIFLEEMGDLHLEDAYRVDRRADRNSWLYGSLYKLHVAKYRRLGHSCVGSHDGQQVMLGDTHKASKKQKLWNDRYFGKENRNVLNSAGAEVETIATALNSNVGNIEGPYIELCPSKTCDSLQNTDVRSRILDQSTVLYVQGKGIEVKSSHGVEMDEVDYKPDSKVETYNRKLRETPNDVRLWLEFVKFQDSSNSQENMMHSSTTEDSEKKLKKNYRAISEKKISILEKALEANPGNIELKLAMLELQSEFCELGKIVKELEQLLFVHPANTKLWKYFLLYNQSKQSLFTVAKVTKQYQKCFKTLASILEGKVQTHSVPKDLDREFLDIFVRYCHFLKQAGHKEKAVASFQALLEFNLFCPALLAGVARETKMDAFEEFWDNNAPRLGAAGARGWKHWTDHKEAMVECKENEDNTEDLEEEILGQKASKCTTWLQMEALREQHHWLPWQPNVAVGQTEEDCEDVDRLVLFDDVAPVVYNIPAHLHPRAVVEFLVLLGIDVDTKLLAPSVGMLKCGMFYEKATELTHSSLQKQSSVFEPLKMGAVVQDFVINLLSCIGSHCTGVQQTELTQLMITVVVAKYLNNGEGKDISKSEKKKLRKFVKNILKEEHNRTNLVIWSAYIALERLLGKAGEAEGIVETALTLHSGVTLESASEQACGLLTLYRLYVEMLLNIDTHAADALWERHAAVSLDTKQNVIRILNCAFEGKIFQKKFDTVGSSSILKTRLKCRKLLQSAAKQVSSADQENDPIGKSYFIEICRCYALFEYCNSGLKSSIGVFDEAISVISDSSQGAVDDTSVTYGDSLNYIVSELLQTLYVGQLQMILYHMSRASTPLCVLRHCLDVAMARFPDSPTFLRLFVDIERRCRVSGRLHKYFDRLVRRADTPSTCVFAVYSQLEFLERSSVEIAETETPGYHGGSTVHRTRSWLERSLSRSSLQHCPLLWRLYFNLEDQYGDLARLKGVFYRGIQQCPWMKELYMDGVRVFGESQHQGIVDMMTEKELCVQIPVEELDILMG